MFSDWPQLLLAYDVLWAVLCLFVPLFVLVVCNVCLVRALRQSRHLQRLYRVNGPSSTSDCRRQTAVKHWRLQARDVESPAANHSDSHRTDRRLHHVRLAVCSALRDRCRRSRVSLDDHPLRPQRPPTTPMRPPRSSATGCSSSTSPSTSYSTVSSTSSSTVSFVNFVLYCVVNFVLYCVVVNFVLYCVVNFLLYCVVRQLRPLLCRQRSFSLHCTLRFVLLRLLLADCRTARQARCRVT